MFNTRPQAPWVPFTIPATPTPEDGKTYALSFSNNAVPTKNPSQFLQWKKIEANLPEGENLGDILYWDPAEGDEGDWVILPPEGSEEEPYFLKYDGDSLSWGPAELPDGLNFGDILYWVPSAGEDGEWQVLTAPQDSTISIKKFDICENGQPKEYNMLVWDQG